MRPRVLVVADVRNWAWAKKAAALVTHLSDRFEIEVAYSSEHATGAIIAARKHDLYHTFDALQVTAFPQGYPVVTGITAHVIQGWDTRYGAGTVRKWASRSIGFHANSRMLQREIEEYLGRPVYYVPNGVDEAFWVRNGARSSKGRLVVGHVGKPNPRKGAEIVRRACERAGVDLLAIDRNSKNAMTIEEMLIYYQRIHVLAVSSDMDGTPNPALEAAACECAIVTNPIGNMPEFIVPGVNGYLTERTPGGLAAALIGLKNRPIEEVEAMGRAARATVIDGWTWAKQAANYAAMWDECLGNAQAAEAG